MTAMVHAMVYVMTAMVRRTSNEASEACGRHPSEAVPSWAKLDSVRILAPTVTYTIWPTYGLYVSPTYDPDTSLAIGPWTKFFEFRMFRWIFGPGAVIGRLSAAYKLENAVL